ncbi:hypothetical protein [Caulobacter sp. UC70_42]|jgi:hypothetical protein|uniref:hypothetical protein n=1 Tax=Caulobacter sp. UC70_42 TaxID=3374551 RepID=UPI003756D8E1
MTQTSSTPALNAELVGAEIVVTGPDGFRRAMSLDTARTSLSNLQRAIAAAGEPQEVYQKPLG